MGDGEGGIGIHSDPSACLFFRMKTSSRHVNRPIERGVGSAVEFGRDRIIAGGVGHAGKGVGHLPRIDVDCDQRFRAGIFSNRNPSFKLDDEPWSGRLQ